MNAVQCTLDIADIMQLEWTMDEGIVYEGVYTQAGTLQSNWVNRWHRRGVRHPWFTLEESNSRWRDWRRNRPAGRCVLSCLIGALMFWYIIFHALAVVSWYPYGFVGEQTVLFVEAKSNDVARTR